MNNLTDKDIAGDILNDIKMGADGYTKAILESSDQNLRQTFVSNLESCINSQWKVFTLMNERSWYQVPTVNDSVNRV